MPKPKPVKKPKQDENDTAPRSWPMRPAGYHSNAAITRRNGGVRHQFLNDIGGCSANYR